MDERLVAQRQLFAAPVAEAPDQLYVRAQAGFGASDRDGLTVRSGMSVTSNTYFGRFPASYWQRWTEVREVRWSATCGGAGVLRMVASDPDGRTRVVHAVTIDSDEPREIEITGPLDRFVDGGALWMDFEATHDTLSVRRARWTVPAPAYPRPTAVAMPSYNRVSYCVKTLLTLAGDQEVLDLLSAVYLIDQGSDAVESSPRFESVVGALGGKLRYIRQPNLGGSGGYSRGLYEAYANHGEHVNVMFLDDDVWLEPDVVVRLTAFEQHTREPVIVGGQMLRLLHPDRLHVGAETANLSALAAGEPVDMALRNANMIEETRESAAEKDKADARPTQFQQEVRVDAGYNGWWACLVPAEVVRNVGYPMPAFFQWDDIEYGYRARSKGYPTVTLPGAGVWHLDFDWKDWDDWHRYFNIRNAMITSALHGGFDRRGITVSLTQQLLRYLASMQYGLAATLLKAVDDFLLGPDMMHDGGIQAAADIRKLRAEFPETVVHPAGDVPGVGFAGAPVRMSGRPPMLRKPTLLLRLARQWKGGVSGTASIPAGSAYWWHISRYSTAVVTDASQEGVRLRRLDTDRLHHLSQQGYATLRELYRRGGTVAGQYRDALPSLTSKENWERLYTNSGH
ncbi:MAG TPA: glycosyltransferase [Pseudonocardiaceae bacterium]|jgi:galactofuranosylgalactofuranosylrhamnosyl-N-acetylglucosaminyl-diphospho-decaprenol beta-1,5/1,6-galactofuranosyltransferase|nr:glycosyltransferase [Pseudonocardiaceae bacterium]